ncbi:F-box protein At3g54460 isoform X2 [Elaeis guineensis]|uniref:F-box protein At3g54460 isoform X2 n=1 Tax=Elaeis guineensis var. tenera TaxID=51953 RepID=UPI003C6D3440
MEDDHLNHHKLCGFLPVVVSVNSPQEPRGDPAPPPPTLAPGTPCFLFSDGAVVGFRSQDGLLLLALQESNVKAETEETEFLAPDKAKIGGFGGGVGTSPSNSKRRRRRRRGVVLVNGSMSVVHQLHALTAHKCLEIEARVVRVSVRGDEEARAVVLIDIYLPIEVWSGWQFPRSRALAASLFKHVRCNWEIRNSMLSFDWKTEHSHADDKHIWSCTDCHVLGCEMHCSSSDSGNKRLFDLYEIFKSLPSVAKEKKMQATRIKPEDASLHRGIWEIADDLLTNVLTQLCSKDLVRVSATCRHLRSLATSIMPCMKHKLFPHQEAAIEWMLKRERNGETLAHPLYMHFSTEDGFSLYINIVTGEISTGMAPMINDFRGGMFCDEPGLGKTVTALSLILKTHGTLADPPHGVDVIWCMHDSDQRCGYYEVSANNVAPGNFLSMWKRLLGQNLRRGKVCSSMPSLGFSSIEMSKSSLRKRGRSVGPEQSAGLAASSCGKPGISSCTDTHSRPVTRVLRCTRSLSHVQRNLLDTYGEISGCNKKRKATENVVDSTNIPRVPKLDHFAKDIVMPRSCNSHKEPRKDNAGSDSSETWVQCDACRKWRKLSERTTLDATAAWFCSMNNDPLHQNCAAPEESWDYKRRITNLPGFYTKGTLQGKEQNISFFTSVLKENFTLLNSETRKALTWLASLSDNKLIEMETVGLTLPVIDSRMASDRDSCGFHKIFQAFGLVRRVERYVSRWYYPSKLDNLAFDLTALRIALTKPLDLFRLYLSSATLIVVPSNLVDHWKTQIQKHVRDGQLRVYVWADNKKPCAHNLAWDYDIVITTFNRLSAEWGPRKRSVLMQVHWLRVIVDEGHTLGSSLSLTNKLQMAISLAASNRWILTGTPTPNTPNSQVAHLQPMLKFLHEEAYGQNQESWEAGILRPFESQMEEGRLRLLQLLQRTMISARKIDLKNIPPCIKKVTFLHFTEEHARSYNELVATVRRNILMADWNDPSHVESLLNPKQWKFRGTTIMNVRLSCCVAGHIKVTDAGQDIQETMDILAQQGLDPLSEEYVLIKFSLLNGCYCLRCKDWCRLPVITPCRHLLCLDCVALDSEKCTFPGCDNPYEMQSPEILTRPENPNPKWPVPKDLIELQPSYKQDAWDPDWQSTSSSKVAYLIECLKVLQESNIKIGYCLDEKDDRKTFINSQKSPCSVFTYQETATRPYGESCNMLPEKVIIFSQFLEHIHVIEQQLAIAGIRYAGMYSPMHSCNKMKSLLIFQQDPNCMALLMDGSAALGLDLSFVTHVFLMEPIWDRSGRSLPYSSISLRGSNYI